MDSIKAVAGIEIGRIVRSRRKTIALVIERDGSLTVRAPNRVTMKFINEFARDHENWIRKHQEKIRTQSSAISRNYDAGELFPYLGKSYPLEFVRGQKTKLRLDGHFMMAESVRGDGKRMFEQWYRERAKELLTEQVNMFAERHQFQFQKVRISFARTRWGSCSSKGVISLSWRLILLPMEVVDYVIIHELCHTAVHNHSSRFWKLVEKYLPEYKEYRRWLRVNGQGAVLE